MDLATLIKAVNTNSAQNEQIKSGIQTAYGAAIGALGEANEAIQRGGAANAVVDTQEELGLLEAQKNARRVATANGTNMSESNEILTFLGDQQRQQALDVAERAKRVDAITQQANLGNPFGLLFDIFYGDGERRALESGRAQLDNTTQTIQSLNQATQASAKTQREIAETKSDATVAAQSEIAMAKAAEAVANNRARMATLNADMLNNINSLNQQQLGNAFRIWQAEESAEQRAFVRAQRDALLEERRAKQAGLDAMMEDFNRGAPAMNATPVRSVQEFQTRLQKDEARTLFIIDKGYELASTGKLSFGNSPLEALAVNQAYRPQVPPVQQPVFNALGSWVQEFEANPGQVMADLKMIPPTDVALENMNYKKLKPADKEALINSVLTNRFNYEYANIKLGDPTNLLSLPNIDSLQGAAFLESNPFLERFVKPSVDAGGDIAYEPGKYIQMAEGAILAGELTTSQVAEGLAAMSEVLFAKGVLAKGLTSAFGFPEVLDYPVVVHTNSERKAFGGPTQSPYAPIQYTPRPISFSKKIDILDSAEWNNYLSDYFRRIYSSAAVEALNNGN